MLRRKKRLHLVRLIGANPELSTRRLAHLSRYSTKTVRRYRNRLKEAAFTAEELIHCDEHAIAVVLDHREAPRAPREGSRAGREGPDFDQLIRPVYLPGMSMAKLWERYREDNEDALSYSQFLRRLDDYMRERRARQPPESHQCGFSCEATDHRTPMASRASSLCQSMEES